MPTANAIAIGIPYGAGDGLPAEAKSLTEDLVSWWPINETSGTRYDSLGIHDLTPYGTSMNIGSGIGQYGALAQSGAQFYTGSSGPTGLSEISLSAWVFNGSYTATKTYINVGGAKLELNLTSMRMYVGSDYAEQTLSAVNQWQHVVGVYDGATITLYLDTVAGTPTAHTGTVDWTQTSIGGASAGSFRFDDVAGWSRALQASDLSFLWNSGRGQNWNYVTSDIKTGLLSWWEFNEFTGLRRDTYGTNHLTANSASSLWTFGGITPTARARNGANFAGNDNDYLTNSSATVVAGDKTLACWVCLRNAPASFAGLISARTDSTDATTGLTLGVNSGGAVIARAYSNGALQSVTGTTISPVSRWTLVVGWWDSALQKAVVQVNNGTESASSASGASTTSVPTAITIGDYWPGSISNDLAGVEAECAYWSRLLTATERTYLYNNGIGRTYSGGKVI